MIRGLGKRKAKSATDSTSKQQTTKLGFVVVFPLFPTLFARQSQGYTPQSKKKKKKDIQPLNMRVRLQKVKMWTRVINTRDLARTQTHTMSQKLYQCTCGDTRCTNTLRSARGIKLFISRSLCAVSFSTCRAFVAGDNRCEIRQPATARCSDLLSSETIL